MRHVGVSLRHVVAPSQSIFARAGQGPYDFPMLGERQGVVLVLAMLVLGCNEDPRTRNLQQDGRHAAPAPTSARAGLRSFRPLIHEVARAELRVGGLVVDFGSADQHKYTRGGWGTGWSGSREDGDVGYAVARAKVARLAVRVIEEPAELLLRVRSDAGSQKLTVSADGRELGTARVGTEWSIARIPVAGIEAGRTLVELSRSAKKKSIDVDWLAFAAESDAEPPMLLPRVAPVSLGGSLRRVLTAPTPRSYSFYLQPPKHGRLVFDTGSSEAVEFLVRAETGAGELVELYRGRATPGRFTEHVVDLAPLAGRAVRLELSTSDGAPRTGWGEPTIYVPREPAPVAARPRARTAKNVIVVVLDTTRADAFAPFAPNTIHTPELDAFAAAGTAFTSAYSQENWTKPSVATMLSSLYPTTHTARKAKSKLPDEVTFLSQHLDAHGFETVMMSANAVISDKFGFARGWDDFQNHSRSTQGNGRHLYRRAAKWLEDHHDDGRFFLWVQSVDAHTTYDVPRRYWSRYFEGEYDGPIGSTFDAEEQIAIGNSDMRISSRDLDWIKALYYGEVTFQDKQLGVLFDKIEELGLYDDTIVVVTNDHGEELREHGSMGHGYSLYEEMTRAPLVVHYPPLLPAATQVDTIVEQVDLAPTLVEALGLPPMLDVDGLSLLDLFGRRPVRQRPLYAVASAVNGTRSIRVGRWKLIVGETKDWLHLFDLERDPGEQHDLVEDASVAGRLCEVYLGEALASPRKSTRLEGSGTVRTLRAEDIDLDDGLRRQLEALGYL